MVVDMTDMVLVGMRVLASPLLEDCVIGTVVVMVVVDNL